MLEGLCSQRRAEQQHIPISLETAQLLQPLVAAPHSPYSVEHTVQPIDQNVHLAPAEVVRNAHSAASGGLQRLRSLSDKDVVTASIIDDEQADELIQL